MLFNSHASKQFNVPNMEIENIEIGFADGFNFLGLTIHNQLNRIHTEIK